MTEKYFQQKDRNVGVTMYRSLMKYQTSPSHSLASPSRFIASPSSRYVASPSTPLATPSYYIPSPSGGSITSSARESISSTESTTQRPFTDSSLTRNPTKPVRHLLHPNNQSQPSQNLGTIRPPIPAGTGFSPIHSSPPEVASIFSHFSQLDPNCKYI